MAETTPCQKHRRSLVYNSDRPRAGLKRFPRGALRRGQGVDDARRDPGALARTCTRSKFAPRVKAIGRAGAGINNIPVDAHESKRGVPVFNAPGANANAVKELVLAGMLIAARNLVPALRVRAAGCDANDADLDKLVEEGKKQFAGFELPGRTLGVIGLGKIGSLVADAAIKLGMNVLGYDPEITVDAAWSLPSQVQQGALDRRGAQGERFRHAARAAGASKTRTPDRREAPRR